MQKKRSKEIMLWW